MKDPVCPKCSGKLQYCSTNPPIYTCQSYGKGCDGAMGEVDYLKAKNEILRKDFVEHLKMHNKLLEDFNKIYTRP